MDPGGSPVYVPRPESDDDAPAGKAGAGSAGKAGKKRKLGGPRASIACKSCRRRKIRCSADWPTCAFCTARNLECEYDGHPAETGGAMPGQLPAASAPLPPVASTSSLVVPLPAKDVLLPAADAFFGSIVSAGLLNFCHRQRVMHAINEATAPLEFVYAMLALSLRFCSVVPAGYASAKAAAAAYADSARALIRQGAEQYDSLDRLHTLLLLAVHDCMGTNHAERGWITLGLACRMAQAQGLGTPIEPPATTGDGDGVDVLTSAAIDAEIRARTYWTCFLLDRMLCDNLGRPSCMRFEPYNAPIKMPRADDDFNWGRWADSARFEASLPAWARPPSQSSNGAAVEPEPEPDLFGFTLRIADLWSRVSAYVAAGSRNTVDRRVPWHPASAFMQLERALHEWSEALPERMRHTAENLRTHVFVGQGQLFGICHILHLVSVLTLHRDYLPFLPPRGSYDAADGPVDGEPLYEPDYPCPDGSPSAWWSKSAATAFAAAHAISTLVTDLAEQGSPLYGQPFSGFAVLSSGTLHCHLRAFCTGETSDAAQEYLLRDAHHLNQVRRYWPLAGQWARSLNVLYDLYCRASLVGEIPTDAKPVRARVMALLQQGDPTRAEHLEEGTASVGPSSPRLAPRSTATAAAAAPPQPLRFNLFSLLKERDAYPPPPSAASLLQQHHAIMPLFDPIGSASTSMASPLPSLLVPSSSAFSPPSFSLGSFGDATLGFGASAGPATSGSLDDLDFAAALGLGGGDQLDWSLFAGPSWFAQGAATTF